MKIKHLKELDIYEVDYSGLINFENGVENMNLLEAKFKELSLSNSPVKIIFDFRNTQWESLEAKYALTKIARKKFASDNLNYTLFTAILNTENQSASFENEHFFIEKDKAIDWLSRV